MAKPDKPPALQEAAQHGAARVVVPPSLRNLTALQRDYWSKDSVALAKEREEYVSSIGAKLRPDHFSDAKWSLVLEYAQNITAAADTVDRLCAAERAVARVMDLMRRLGYIPYANETPLVRDEVDAMSPAWADLIALEKLS